VIIGKNDLIDAGLVDRTRVWWRIPAASAIGRTHPVSAVCR
jgi:hypothetical protein